MRRNKVRKGKGAAQVDLKCSTDQRREKRTTGRGGLLVTYVSGDRDTTMGSDGVGPP